MVALLSHAWPSRRYPMRRALLLLLAAAAFLPLAAGAQRLPPHRFFGRVTVNGAAPPVGTVVEAFIGNTRCGTGQTTSGGNYVIDVDHGTSTPGCGFGGATITFRVSGVTATPTATFRDGGFEPLDLTVS